MRRLILSDLEEKAGDCEAACCLAEVRRAVQACQRCIVITGAGISVSSGIPDFRSPDGLFQQLKQKYPSSVSTGRDLFDATLFHYPDMVGLFYNFMGELRNLVSQATCTPTHEFIKRLDENGKLLRCYTQNIDSLEKRIGLETSFQRPCSSKETKDCSFNVGQTAKEKGLSDSSDCNANSSATRRRRQTTLDKKFTRAVQLHGDLDNVVCTICHTKYPFTQQLAQEFCEGTPPPCPRCKEVEAIRDIVGKRSVTAGVLRPDIVLYNEAHPQSELIGSLSEYDLKRRPDLLIVIGTSLKIPGIKRMIKEMSRCVHDSAERTKRAGAGKAIYINRDEPPRGWDDVFDYYIAGDADQAISMLPIAHNAESTIDSEETSASESAPKCAMNINSICNAQSSETLTPDTKPNISKKQPQSIAQPARRQPIRSKSLATALPRKDTLTKPNSRKLTSMMKVVKSTSLKPKAKPSRQRPHRTNQQVKIPTSPLIYS
ncbi:NAD-dependent deacetylase hst3 [Coemansia brasiliensis]|uniref:NAD-dependent deacetylase hst3 n=1 Tax=Coemansia brasiliensis TaxID=2650707 RepID=A0A9W8I9D1_9FUNG|nr:NAD-dependent deacetylase hst3 [Coemansia brasiliensis]